MHPLELCPLLPSFFSARSGYVVIPVTALDQGGISVVGGDSGGAGLDVQPPIGASAGQPADVDARILAARLDQLHAVTCGESERPLYSFSPAVRKARLVL